MSNKRRFSLLLRPDERQALQRLAQLAERSQGGMIRLLIREEARRRGLLPTDHAGPLSLGSARSGQEARG